MKKVTEQLIRFIESEEFLKSNFKALYLIGNRNQKEVEGFQDTDFAMVVNSNCSLIDVIQSLSQKIVEITKAENILISVFPIHEVSFKNQNTMFIKNITTNGVKIK